MGITRVGIIGCGWIFQNEHVLGYLATSHGYIHGFCDVSKELAEKSQNLYNDGMKKRLEKAKTPEEKDLCEKGLQSQIYTDAEQMLPEVDAIDICTPPQFHMKYAQLAAEAGKTILCEKPLARSWLDAKDTLNLLKDVPFYIFTQTIYNAIFKLGKEIIDSGKLGEIVRTKNCHASLDMDHATAKENFWKPLVSGGGCLMDIGPHAYSVMRYWMGPKYHLKSVKDIGIATRTPNRTIEGKPNYSVLVDDVAKLLIEWEDDAGHIVKSELDAYWGEQPPELKYGLYHEIEGTKATLTIPNGTLGFLLGKKPYFGIHVFYKITFKDGHVEKISIPQPKIHSESLIAIDEFLAGVESRSPAWYGEDMMILLDSGYLSKKLNQKEISPDEFNEYADQFGSGSDAAEAMIKDLFNLS